MAGSAKLLAIAVGKNSQWGIIKSKLEKEQKATPLQEKLDDMAALIGYIRMGAAGATFLAMMFIKLVVQPDYLQEVSVFSYALEAYIIGVTIVVIAVPEGYLPVIFGTKRKGALLLLAQSGWSHHDDTNKRRQDAKFDKPDGSRLFPIPSARKRISVLVHMEGKI